MLEHLLAFVVAFVLAVVAAVATIEGHLLSSDCLLVVAGVLAVWTWADLRRLRRA